MKRFVNYLVMALVLFVVIAPIFNCLMHDTYSFNGISVVGFICYMIFAVVLCYIEKLFAKR